MAPLFVLVCTLALLRVLPWGARRSWTDRTRIALGVMLAFTGLSHFIIPDMFLAMTPAGVPLADLAIYLVGGAELVGAAALWMATTPMVRRLVGQSVAALFAVLYALNVYHTLQGDTVNGPGSLTQLAVQTVIHLVFIGAAMFVSYNRREGREADAGG